MALHRNNWLIVVALLSAAAPLPASAELQQQVMDIPTRRGVTQRFLLLKPDQPKAVVVLFAGGHGGLQISTTGQLGKSTGNFLVRSRELFAQQGLAVAVVDAPSDRQQEPFLTGFRQTAEHAADIKALIAWLRVDVRRPVWLVGTSRGTQSAGYLATALTGAEGPDGVVLTSTVLTDSRERPVPEMPIEKLAIPVLVVHHEQDGCRVCRYADMPKLIRKLEKLGRHELITFRGGINEGNACKARAYHGFNGLEPEVVGRIAAWIAGPVKARRTADATIVVSTLD